MWLLKISLRYLIIKRKWNLVQIFSLLSIISVLVSTSGIIVVDAGFNGLVDAIKKSYFWAEPQISITHKKSKFINNPDSLITVLTSKFRDINFMPSFEDRCLVKYDERVLPAKIRAINSAYIELSGIDKNIIERNDYLLKHLDEGFVIVSEVLANALNIGTTQIPKPIYIYVPTFGSGDLSSVSVITALPAGIIPIFGDFGEGLIIMPLKKILEECPYTNCITSIYGFSSQINSPEKITSQIAHAIGDSYHISAYSEDYQTLLRIARLEKIFAMVILFTIFLLSAGGVLFASLIQIMEKSRDIILLKSLGWKLSTIRKIFILLLIEKIGIGVIGGFLLGIFLVWLQRNFGIIPMENAIVPYYPMKIEFIEIASLLILMFLLTTLALLPIIMKTIKREYMKSPRKITPL